MKRNTEFEVCYYAIGALKCHCKCVTVEVATHKGSMTFEDFLILKDSLKKSLENERYENIVLTAFRPSESEWERAAHFDFVAMTADDGYIIMDNNYDWLSWSYQA
ncbi:hypothetical protein [Streptococcus vestibularis]|uniref:hypothetical protein n=1 Tax=Streptococcus vestibularis TaxID=1343 RepID=UPI0026728CAA|nr:hypothetical protein [Streptococcus vestibularis]